MLMELTSISNIKSLLKKYNTVPSKRFGQNFLIDKNVVRKILNQAKLVSKDVVLEIGPGIGTMTTELAQKAGKVIAVEKDTKMIEVLKETTQDFQNIEIINADILNLLSNNEQVRSGRQRRERRSRAGRIGDGSWQKTGLWSSRVRPEA